MTEYKVIYDPSEQDLRNVEKITTFLNSRSIPYTTDDEIFGLIRIHDVRNNAEIQLRYVSSPHYRMDNSKRFGPEHKGVPRNYFIDISHANMEKGIRTIWIFDFEMAQHEDVLTLDGELLKDYHRQWEVIKNTICTATGHIDHKFYARDCEICLVDNAELRPFLQTNCFYGYRSASVNLGLRLKKDKNGFKKGTLMFVYTFGYNFFGNRKRQDKPLVEIIRVSTRLGCQVVGGSSKCLTYFLQNYPTMKVGDREINVNELRFMVDASHLDSRSMYVLGFKPISWAGEGFVNVFLKDVDEVYVRPDGKKFTIKGKAGEVGQRKPAVHVEIMRLIKEGYMVSVANAGTAVFSLMRDEYLAEHHLSDKT